MLSGAGMVLAEALLSQQEHAAFGGVVPEIAARAHLAHLPQMVRAVLRQARLLPEELGAVAATVGPGLIGGLIVGSGVGKGLALAAGVPFVAVNHLEAHALSARLPGLGAPGLDSDGPGGEATDGVSGGGSEGVTFPYVLLLVSGGHCQCVAVEGVGRYRRLGGTIDDAVGEAFDKVAKMLGLGWPGGPALERLARSGDATGVRLPRPLLGREGCDFSFSGLKTAVAQRVAAYPAGPLQAGDAADIAAGFQAACAEVLADRAGRALAMLSGPGLAATALVVAGGVAANAAVRAALQAVAQARGVRLVAPPVRLCTDNAVMVAWAAIERLRLGEADGRGVAPRPRWPLEELREPGMAGDAAAAGGTGGETVGRGGAGTPGEMAGGRSLA